MRTIVDYIACPFLELSLAILQQKKSTSAWLCSIAVHKFQRLSTSCNIAFSLVTRLQIFFDFPDPFTSWLIEHFDSFWKTSFCRLIVEKDKRRALVKLQQSHFTPRARFVQIELNTVCFEQRPQQWHV